MKRINPQTGKYFERGDLRDDGYRFIRYSEKISTEGKHPGYFLEQFASPAIWKRMHNPETRQIIKAEKIQFKKEKKKERINELENLFAGNQIKELNELTKNLKELFVDMNEELKKTIATIAELREEASDPSSKDNYLDTNALAKRWSKDPRTLANWRGNGQGPKHFKIGGKVLYDLKDIIDYEKESF
jgi:hypothetical protein